MTELVVRVEPSGDAITLRLQGGQSGAVLPYRGTLSESGVEIARAENTGIVLMRLLEQGFSLSIRRRRRNPPMVTLCLERAPEAPRYFDGGTLDDCARQAGTLIDSRPPVEQKRAPLGNRENAAVNSPFQNSTAVRSSVLSSDVSRGER